MEAGNTNQNEVRGWARRRTRPSPPALPCAVQLQVTAFSVGIDAINRRDGTVNRCLYGVADRLLRVRAVPRPDGSGVRSHDFAVDASRGLWTRVFSPAASTGPRPLPLVVYFHGGGFAVFSAAQCYFDRLCRRLCRGIGAVVVSVEYRLAPEHPYPAAYDDATDTLLFIDAKGGVPGLGDDVPVDLSSCFLAGESAGGNIIHHVADRWAAAAATRQPTAVRLTGLLSVQPFFGGEERTESELRLDGVAPIVNLRRSDFWWKAFLPAGVSRNHPAAHVTDENAQAVQVVEFPEGIHAFYLFPQLAASAEVIEEMRAFVESNRAPSATPESSTTTR